MRWTGWKRRWRIAAPTAAGVTPTRMPASSIRGCRSSILPTGRSPSWHRPRTAERCWRRMARSTTTRRFAHRTAPGTASPRTPTARPFWRCGRGTARLYSASFAACMPPRCGIRTAAKASWFATRSESSRSISPKPRTAFSSRRKLPPSARQSAAPASPTRCMPPVSSTGNMPLTTFRPLPGSAASRRARR